MAISNEYQTDEGMSIDYHGDGQLTDFDPFRQTGAAAGRKNF